MHHKRYKISETAILIYLALELLSLITVAKLANSTGQTCFGSSRLKLAIGWV